jgi:hypothetical protein
LLARALVCILGFPTLLKNIKEIKRNKSAYFKRKACANDPFTKGSLLELVNVAVPNSSSNKVVKLEPGNQTVVYHSLKVIPRATNKPTIALTMRSSPPNKNLLWIFLGP